MLAGINKFFELVNTGLAKLFFFDVLFFIEGIHIPFVILLLSGSAVFFTLKMRFVNLVYFTHAWKIIFRNWKKSTSSSQQGEISNFKALTTALSATVGLGNIAGVAVAISVGGPGACFWMIVCGLLAMSTKFTECSLALIYRNIQKDGKVMGGPMVYLKKGLAEKGMPRLGLWLAGLFSVLCIGGSFAGGTAFQVNQSLNAISLSLPFLADNSWVYGCLMVVLVGLVILGGLKKIASVTSKIVPFMCGIYVLMSIFIIFSYFTEIPQAFATIFQGAFESNALFGGFVGVLITGMQRAFFSNESGLGSATIVHSAAKVQHPVEEGFVALLEPFIDTVVICTMTALVIVITGVYEQPELLHLVQEKKGAALTSEALGSVVSWFPYVLSLSVFLFAFSTIISWSYYGERCYSFLFGEKTSFIYKILVLVMAFLGAVATSTNIMEFGDLMILGMAIPNLIGVLFLHGKVKHALADYQEKYIR